MLFLPTTILSYVYYYPDLIYEELGPEILSILLRSHRQLEIDFSCLLHSLFISSLLWETFL